MNWSKPSTGAQEFHGLFYWSVGMTPRTNGFDFTIPVSSGNRERLDLTPF
jgi:hypothetical protein